MEKKMHLRFHRIVMRQMFICLTIAFGLVFCNHAQSRIYSHNRRLFPVSGLSVRREVLLEMNVPPGVTKGVQVGSKDLKILNPHPLKIRFTGTKQVGVKLRNGLSLQTSHTAVAVDYDAKTYAIRAKIVSLPDTSEKVPEILLTLSGDTAKPLKIESSPSIDISSLAKQSFSVQGKRVITLSDQTKIIARRSHATISQDPNTKNITVKLSPVFP